MKKKPGPAKRSGSTAVVAPLVETTILEKTISKRLTFGAIERLICVLDTTTSSAANPLPIISDYAKSRLCAHRSLELCVFSLTH